MAVANFGITTRFESIAANMAKVQSITPIGIVGTDSALSTGLHFFLSIKKAREKIGKGSINRALKAIEEQSVDTPVILSVYEHSELEWIANARKAIRDFVSSQALFAYRPDLIIAPEISYENAINAELSSVALGLKAIAIYDIDASSVEEAITKRSENNSEVTLACFPNVKIFNDETNEYEFAPQSARVAGMIARVDGEWEHGYADSYSSKNMAGIFGTQIPINFILGESCDADELRVNNISTIINYEGYKAWGARLVNKKTELQSLSRIRTYNRLSQALAKALFYVVDERTKLYTAKRTAKNFFQSLMAASVVIGEEIDWSNENTETTIVNGIYFLRIKYQDEGTVDRLDLDFKFTDMFGKDKLEKLRNS